MVKNLPSVERSTKIRFGKHVPDSNDQEENTIVFNASNVAVPTPYSNSVYLSPIRNRTDYTAPEIVLLMYDRATKEITESGESANALIGGSTLDAVTNRSNATSNVMQLTGLPVSVITSGNVGIANALPLHTLSVGSNLYINDQGSDILVVSGNASILRDMTIEGNLTVNGDTTVIYTENTSIKDALIELGRDNTLGDTTLDLGVLMHRPGALSNVVIGYREETDEFAIAYTDAQPTDKTFTPKSDEDIDVHVYGRVLTEANVGIINTSPIHTLDVGSNLYVDDIASNILVARGNVDLLGDVTVSENVYIEEDLLVTGNIYANTNVSITDRLTVSGNVYADKDLEVVGNAYVSGNVVAYKDLTLSGNAYVSGNVNVTKQLSVSGNAYVSGNVEVTKSLIVSANTHLKGDNVFITHTMDFLDPKTAIVTDQVSNVQIRLGQLENVANTASNPLINQVLTYDQDNSEWSNAYPDQTIVLVKNTSGAPMTRGQAVHVTGSNGNNMFQVDLADASDASKMPAIGIVYEDIPENGEGAAVTFGRANGIDGISDYTNGDTLYVASGTPGGLTNVKPYGVDLDLIQNIGVVVNHSSGVVFVTGIGRANDIPNARIITDYNDMQYVYVNSENNDLKKIASPNLNIPLTTAVSSSSNSAANAVTLRGVSITSGDGFHGDLVVAGNVTVDTNTLKVDAEANRVGLGTTNPTQTLDVRGSISTDDYLIHNGDTNTKIGFSGDDTFVVNTSGIEQLKVDSEGDTFLSSNLNVDINTLHVDSVSNRVGILTTAPGQPLDVRGAANVGTFTTTTGTVTDATHSTSKDTGVLVLTQGGLGVEANIHSTNVFAASHIAVGTSATSNTFDVRGTANVGALVATSTHISDSTAVISKTTGALQVTGGVGIQGDIHATHANLEDVEADSVNVTDTTEATNQTTGALKVAGGVGIQKDLYARDGHFSTDVSVGSLTNKYIPYANASKILTDSQISQEADGTIVISNDVEISGSLLVGGESFTVSAGELVVQDRIIDIANNNPDHTLDIGILMEHPGHNIGIIHHDTDELTIGYTQAGYGDDHVLWDTSNHITMNVWGHVITQNTVTVEYNDVYIVGGGLGIGIGDRGDGTPDANIHVVGNVFVTSNISTTGNVIIQDATSATSKTTGALQVAGGVGVSGALYGAAATFDGVTSVTNATAATGKTDGALVVTGGVGVSGALYGAAATFDGVTSVTNATASTGKTDGALVVTGGVGISGDIHATHANLEDVEADSVNVIDTTVAYSTTTGALKVAGGISTQANLYVGKDTYITSNLNVDGSTLHVDSASDKVGIGKTDPGFTLDVAGDINFSGSLYEGGSLFVSTPWTIETGPDALSYTAGNIGIGVANPDATLHITGNTYVSSNLTVDTSTLHVDSVSNRVGIGKTDPDYKLHVEDSTNPRIMLENTDTALDENQDIGSILFKQNDASSRGTGIIGKIRMSSVIAPDRGAFYGESANMIFSVGNFADDNANIDALTIRGNGNFGIGETAPTTKLHVAGGTITNSDQVAKKTYSYSGDLPSDQTIANSTIKLTFTNHTFSAKVVAHLIESDDEVSTISFECCGGNWNGDAPANAIALGPVTVFGPTSTNPWDPAVTTTTTTVSFKPTTNMAVAGHYNVFVEYFSQNSAGELTSLHEGATAEVPDFGY